MPDEPFLNFARWYDPIFEILLSGLRATAARVAPQREGMKGMDIGCGTGAQLEIYHAAGCQVYCIDLAQPMLKIARSKLGEGAVLSVGDALRIPHPDQAFDLVISSLFIHQLQPGLRTVMLEESARVLKPDGQILLVDFHVQAKRSFLGKLTYAFISVIEFFAGWEHFSNSRDFLANGGIPTLVSGLELEIQKSIIVGNGNLGVYLLHQDD